MNNQTIESYCRNCYKNTNHKILPKHDVRDPEGYYEISYQIVECQGCQTISFRKVFKDFEKHYHLGNDTYEIPEDVTIYPKSIKGHKEIDDLYMLPKIVGIIYSEILIAIRENSKLLAGLGLRTAIEAVCDDLKIKETNLVGKIEQLETKKYISKNDADRLHGIRFMGNDAAHQFITPEYDSLYVALEIVEHLINSVYILEKKASRNIETTISKYETFENLLNKSLKDFNVGDEYPLSEYLGSDKRRIMKSSLSKFEQELISKIDSGEFTKLSKGKFVYNKGSKTKSQYFVVNK